MGVPSGTVNSGAFAYTGPIANSESPTFCVGEGGSGGTATGGATGWTTTTGGVTGGCAADAPALPHSAASAATLPALPLSLIIEIFRIDCRL